MHLHFNKKYYEKANGKTANVQSWKLRDYHAVEFLQLAEVVARN